VKRIFVSFPIADYALIKLKMLNWAKRFNIFCFLDNHQYPSPHHSHECLLAVGALDFLSADAGNALAQLKDFSARYNDWLFGHFSYDLKNEIEDLVSENPDHIGFPDLFFFVPEIIIELSKNKINIGCFDHAHDHILDDIIACDLIKSKEVFFDHISIESKFSKQEYIETVELLRKHILRGDCYEINFCQEFFVEKIAIDALTIYDLLTEISPNPFSAFYRVNDRYLICASPERYLKRVGEDLLSQPIKGTWQKNFDDMNADELNKERLFHSKKDRSENVMVVDLVRNDFSKICKEGSVVVDELFGVYSFPQLHHMISSVTGKLKDNTDWIDIIKATFPMGSMTGAPKKKVMQLIEQYEKTKRGVFSGAVGYLDPKKNFDFNVVIRSIFYNGAKEYLSFLVGSGITFYSDPVNEYEECLLKMSSIKKVLTG